MEYLLGYNSLDKLLESLIVHDKGFLTLLFISHKFFNLIVKWFFSEKQRI